jgi:hypothetical protein
MPSDIPSRVHRSELVDRYFLGDTDARYLAQPQESKQFERLGFDSAFLLPSRSAFFHAPVRRHLQQQPQNHFDFNLLREAYNEFARVSNERNPDQNQIDAAFLRIGALQRQMPAHLMQQLVYGQNPAIAENLQRDSNSPRPGNGGGGGE